MSFKVHILAITTLLITATTLPAYAGFSQGYSGSQHHAQSESIWRGVRNGRITPNELNIIRSRQNKIRFLKHKFKRDGVLSKKERRILNRKRDRLDKSIRRLATNDNYRYSHNRSRHYSPSYSYRWPQSNYWWKRSYNLNR